MARNYNVGYRKPPAQMRFRPGRSGNPKGRPKKSLNLATELAAELSETVMVREGGKTRKVSKQKALLKSLLAKALQGDVKAIAAALALAARVSENTPEPEDDVIPDDELQILQSFAPQAAKAVQRKKKKR